MCSKSGNLVIFERYRNLCNHAVGPHQALVQLLTGNYFKELEDVNGEPTSVCRRLRMEQISVQPTSMLDRDSRKAYTRHILTTTQGGPISRNSPTVTHCQFGRNRMVS
jgi:hypothetical protein